MKKLKFSLTVKDKAIVNLIEKSSHKTLAAWAIDCVERILIYFDEAYPEDHRPQQAIAVLRTWINTGKFSMAVIRKAALDSHAAALLLLQQIMLCRRSTGLQAHLMPRIMLLKSEHGNISIWLNYSEFRNQGVYSWTIKQGLLCSEYYEAS